MELPKEIWYLIVGDSGLVFKSLFLVSKHLNGLLEGIKKEFIFTCPIYEKPYLTDVITNTIKLFKHNDTTFHLKYDEKNYVLKAPEQWCYNNIYYGGNIKIKKWSRVLDVLEIRVNNNLTFLIKDKCVYDIQKVHEYHMGDDMLRHHIAHIAVVTNNYNALTIKLLLACFKHVGSVMWFLKN